jgi:hypothetical protein
MVQALQERYRTDPLAQAVAVKSWLDKNGIYSRQTRHGDDEQDPTGSFLFGDRTGYCVHFAHAAVFLLRNRGVAARVGGGYAVEEAARGSGSTIMIRGGNAHAWPEIYIEGVGWVIVDISPERSLDPPMEAPDSSLQRSLGMTLRNSFGEKEELPQQAAQVSQEDLRNLALFSLAALLLLAYTGKAYRRVVPAFARTSDLHRVGYRATLDHLSDLGLRRAHGETRERFADRSRAWAPSLEPLTALHLGSALGSSRPAPPERVRALRGAVRGEVRRTVKPWRRILGLLDPISWLRVR